MKLALTERAIANLDDIYDYIAEDNPSAAARVIRQIRTAAFRLCDFPFIGTVGPTPGQRRWVVSGLPYVIVYEVDEDRERLLIVNVFHGARKPPH